ncbi:LysM peptidoglycan-binding domain-containing protein [Emticicia sp. TH156]|uniref:DPBB and LysM peptidoglycan-binding domain-containing protein n=1 Tax=Emticicia sp. TH156 TaxID=2067454 RepID=UPI000C75DB80|nr:LysM peptidoglycan-binding domain-containing protein [Emticicia sp. TH156]PLK45531.1 hypothetical protein C0V77_05190 [Emticicia sp. TH156]
MLRYFFTIAFLVLYLTDTFGNSRISPLDSLGIEKKNGKIFVLHRVEQGETLYSLLRRYASTEKDFFEANPELKKNAQVNALQIISIPVQSRNKPATTHSRVIEIQETTSDTARPKSRIDENGIEIVDVPEATPKDTETTVAITKPELAPKPIDPNAKTHKVMAGEGLYGIAKKYNVKVAQIKEWNNLTSDGLMLDQILIVGKITPAAREEKKEPIQPKTTTNAPTALAEKPKTVVAPAADEEKNNQQVVTKPLAGVTPGAIPNAPTGKKYSEQGIAEMIEAGTHTNKYLALHRTAPVGTLIKIENDANGQSVWVKVIGKLTGPGDAIVKISPMAFQKLQPRDKRIRASLSYAL